ncbi:uncharacterized protein LOC124551172 isoform X1 [Schistocerca americana]|uniref:uncharacterized protein LOC124716974 n=1 Tax=Schistocerca piceifrons TaxID=274613 RepID=UPI001F4F3177|nr:uncharacterized protein LOC124551172 isoform X1 [Schistocerca americana]XP_047099532.1 uncharacterized protein LOC124716974 [Schistocerca piceifrons]
MSWHLTEGAVATLMQGGAIERPVMQIVDSLRVIDRDHETYQLMVSDGSHMSSMAMLSTQWNVRMRSGQLSLYSVVRVNRFRMINYAEDGDEKRIMLIHNLAILAKGTEVGKEIGNPVLYTEHEVEPRAAAPQYTERQSKTARALSRLRARVLFRETLYTLEPHTAVLQVLLRRRVKQPPLPMRRTLLRAASLPWPPLRAELQHVAEMPPDERRVAVLSVSILRVTARIARRQLPPALRGAGQLPPALRGAGQRVSAPGA